MFKNINQINNVLSFIISYKNLFYVDKNKTLFKNNAIINTGVDTFCYDFVEEETIYVKDENTFINNLIIEEKTYLRNSKNLSSRTILLDGEYNSLSDGFECNYYLYDILNKKLNRIANFRNLRNHLNKNKYLFLSNKNSIHAYSLPDATPLWQYEVSELGAYDVLFSTEKRNYEVVKFLGVWQEELLVAFQGSLLMAFDVQTGKVTRQWQELPAHADEELRNIFRGKIHEKGTVFQLNLAGDKIVAIYLRHYLEIDLATSEIHVKNLSQTLHQHLMVDFNHKSGYAEDETHFYTTVHLDQEKLGLKYIPRPYVP